MKRAILTMDVEDFSDVHCLWKVDPKKLPSAMDGFDFFENAVEGVRAKATFFCLAESIDRDGARLKEAVGRGHEIGVHGLHHDLCAKKPLKQFQSEIKEAKKVLEERLHVNCEAYRAPAFNLNEEELASLKELGFRCDVSKEDVGKHYIDYGDHVKAEGFVEASSGVLEKDGFYEIPMPVATSGLFRGFPIGGGVFPRFWTNFTYFRALRHYLKTHDTFVFYCHPFEFSLGTKIHPKGVRFHERFYCNRHRAKYRKTFLKILKVLQEEGFAFSTLHDLVDGRSLSI